MGARCSSAEAQVCHRSYIIAARLGGSTYQTLLLVGLSFECPKTLLTSKGNLFPLKQSVLLTYESRWRQVELTVLGLVKNCLNNCFIYNVIPKKSTCMICVINYIIVTTFRMRNLIRTL